MTIIRGDCGELKSAGYIWIKGKKPLGSNFKTVKLPPTKAFSYDEDILVAIDNDGIVRTMCSNDKSNLDKGYVGTVCQYPNVCILNDIGVMKDVCVGLSHIYLLGADNQLYQIGSSEDGIMGSSSSQMPFVRSISSKAQFETIGTNGVGSYYGISTNASVFFWGNNECGNLEFSGEFINEPTVLLTKDRVKMCSMSVSSTYLILEGGNCLRCGYEYNCESEPNMEYYEEFKKFYIEPLSYISSGTDHSAAITTRGQVYTWGRNDDGQLGLSCDKKSSCPIRLSIDDKGYICYCEGNRTAVVMENGTVYGFGYNGNNKSLGINKHVIVNSPTKICSVKVIKPK